jgi:hypothetical protein
VESVADDDEAGERVGPPPAGECIEEQADEHGGGEVAVDHRHPRLGLEHAVAELPTGPAFAPGEREHHEHRCCEPADSEQRVMRPRTCDEHICGLAGDIGGEREKRDPDDPQRAALAAVGHSAQLPDDDERRDDLNQRVEAEARESD